MSRWDRIRQLAKIQITDAQRIRLKWLAMFLGVILLLLFWLLRCLLYFYEKKPEPVIRTLRNIWIVEQTESSLTVFEDGERNTYLFGEDFLSEELMREQIADITLSDELITGVNVKSEKAGGKVLAVTAEGVELADVGFLPFQNGWKGYRIYHTLISCGREDIRIGYDFTDFVLENGEICAVLLAREERMDYIRVLIRSSDFASLYHEQLTIGCDTDFTVRYMADGVLQETECTYDTVLAVDNSHPGLESGRLWIVPKALTGKLTLNNVTRNQGIPAYRGSLEIVNTPEGLVVINEVLLEEYLYSVVPSEMPSVYPAEALKAQAVCARTYASQRMLKAGLARFGAHVDDSTAYQVYNNIAEQESTTEAVKATFGRILTDPDTNLPADTYYYSTSCGLGTDADIWNIEKGKSPAYLQATVISRNSEAQVPQTEEELAALLETVDPDAYELHENWYRWQYMVTEVDPEVMYQRLTDRFEATPERILTVADDGSCVSRPVEPWKELYDLRITGREDGQAAAVLELTTDQGVYRVLTEYNIRYVLCDGQTKAVRQDGGESVCTSLLPSGFFVIAQNGPEKGYTLIGGGHGHGAGMSQNGAKNMALDGMDFEGILTFFYRNCLLRQLYEM